MQDTLEADKVRRAMLQECSLELLKEELARRGYTWVRVTPALHAEQRQRGSVNIRFDSLPERDDE